MSAEINPTEKVLAMVQSRSYTITAYSLDQGLRLEISADTWNHLKQIENHEILGQVAIPGTLEAGTKLKQILTRIAERIASGETEIIHLSDLMDNSGKEKFHDNYPPRRLIASISSGPSYLKLLGHLDDSETAWAVIGLEISDEKGQAHLYWTTHDPQLLNSTARKATSRALYAMAKNATVDRTIPLLPANCHKIYWHEAGSPFEWGIQEKMFSLGWRKITHTPGHPSSRSGYCSGTEFDSSEGKRKLWLAVIERTFNHYPRSVSAEDVLETYARAIMAKCQSVAIVSRNGFDPGAVDISRSPQALIPIELLAETNPLPSPELSLEI